MGSTEAISAGGFTEATLPLDPPRPLMPLALQQRTMLMETQRLTMLLLWVLTRWLLPLVSPQTLALLLPLLLSLPLTDSDIAIALAYAPGSTEIFETTESAETFKGTGFSKGN